MIRPALLALPALVCVLVGCTSPDSVPTPHQNPSTQPSSGASSIELPSPVLPPGEGLAQLLHDRHSTRDFQATSLSSAEVASVLWAGYGLQDDGGVTVPSAGGIYPMTLYLVAGDVTGLLAGVYTYQPDTHAISLLREGDLRVDLRQQALDQNAISQAPAVVVVAGSPDHLRTRYHDRSEQFAALEAGHIGQNVSLAAESLGLGYVPIGSFDDNGIRRVLGLPADDQVYYLIPIGQPR